MKKQKNAPQILPREEWPYEVPENWVWTRLENISNIIMGQSPLGNDTTDDSSFTPLIGGASDLGEIYPSITKYTKIITKEAKINDIILCIRATLGHPVFADRIYCLGRGVASIRSRICSKELLKYFFINFEQYLYDHATGTTFTQITGKVLNSMPFPLIPLPEQQRIVTLIESLFAKLDAAAEKIRAAIDAFPTRKAALLHKAFTGELTKKWREAHGVGLDSWGEYCLHELTDVRDGTHDSPLYYDTGFPLITSKNLRNGIITKTDVKYISKEDYDKINMRSKVAKGDILFAMIGTIGNPVVVEEYPDFAIKNVALFKDINKINMHYLQYFLDSESVKNRMNREAKGSTQKFVALQYLRKFHITVPTLPEQQEIVRRLDAILAREQTAKETAERLLDTIALTKKSILARAFRGLLGTNNPKEKSAEGLLRDTNDRQKG